MNNNIKSYLQNIQQEVLNTLSKEAFVSFSHIENFPTESGVYFIYDKNKTLVYIGAAMNIQHRCNQYIIASNTGATFRYNLIQNLMKPHNTIAEIKKMKQLNFKYALLIKNYYSAKFILVPGTKRNVAYEESIYISAFNLKLNKFNL